jgi:hypothetical protein
MAKRTIELWHAAGRSARDGRKRFVALMGVLASAPLLLAGSAVLHVLSPGDLGVLEDLSRPLVYVGRPVTQAYEADADVALLGALAWYGLLLTLLWAWFGGVLHRQAAVDIATGRKEPGAAAVAFARRHWRSFAGARVALWLGFVVPLAVAAGLALLGRLPGAFGGVLLVVATLAAGLLALVAVSSGSLAAAAGFLAGPAIACEDSDAFDALSRTTAYAAAGLPRLVALRALFFCGVLLGSLWRLLRAAAAFLLALGVVSLGAGPGALDGALAVLEAGGPPGDAARLDLGAADYGLAAALAALALGLLVLWLADLVTRVVCARSAVFLRLREEVDGVAADRLRTPARGERALTAEQAGFVEVGRV